MENAELGVTVFKFGYPSSPEQFIEKVSEWMRSTTEGNRYIIKDPEDGIILKIQRGKGHLTAPIVIEFRHGPVLGIPTEIQVTGYVSFFGLNYFKQDLRPDAMTSIVPRRNGWKDMLRLLDFTAVSNYEHQFHT